MSTLTSIKDFLRSAPWRLWAAQIVAILRTDLKKNLLKKRNFWVYILAFGPTLVIGLYALKVPSERANLREDTDILAGIFQFFFLRLHGTVYLALPRRGSREEFALLLPYTGAARSDDLRQVSCLRDHVIPDLRLWRASF